MKTMVVLDETILGYLLRLVMQDHKPEHAEIKATTEHQITTALLLLENAREAEKKKTDE